MSIVTDDSVTQSVGSPAVVEWWPIESVHDSPYNQLVLILYIPLVSLFANL